MAVACAKWKTIGLIEPATHVGGRKSRAIKILAPAQENLIDSLIPLAAAVISGQNNSHLLEDERRFAKRDLRHVADH